MSPDISAQIIAKAWSDDNFAQALRGPDAYAAIQDALGVTLPEGAALPEIPPVPMDATTEGLGVQSEVRAGMLWCRIYLQGFLDEKETAPKKLS